MQDLLKRLRRIVPVWLTDIRFPSWRFRDPEIRLTPVAAELRHVVNRDKVDALDAFQANLQSVIGALEAGGHTYFIEEGLWAHRPLIGLTQEVALDILRRFHMTGRSVPVYVEPLDSEGWRRATLARALTPADMDSLSRSGFTVFTVLRHATTGRKLAESQGCQVTIWERQEDGDLANLTPREGLTTAVPVSDQVVTSIQAHGLGCQTFSPLAERLLQRHDFPIDVVYLWVDGSDPVWQESKSDRLDPRGGDDNAEATLEQRYRHFDELRYSLRSLDRFAPWVRNIYLVTDRQRPEWLDETGTNLRVVDHTEILPGSALPTFNSHALTAGLHHIEGIADHFVLFNDDMLVGRPVGPDAFFDDNGVSLYFLSRTLINEDPEVAHEHARVHSADIIESVTGTRPRHVLKHAPYTFNRTLLQSIEDELPDVWKQTVNSPFRSPTDVVPEYMHHYLGHDRRMSRPADIGYGYFAVGSDPSLRVLTDYQRGNAADVFCLNDEGSTDARYHEIHRNLQRFLETEFPHPSRYETAG